MSLSLLPLPFNGILNGLILYGLLRYYTLGLVKPQLAGEDYDPLPIISTAIGLLITGSGLFMMFTMTVVPAHFSWLPSSGITLILYAVGMPAIRRHKNKVKKSQDPC